ncbi:MAG: hypothetical protein ACRD0N_04100 [Acidimicrobiales bacterium]
MAAVLGAGAALWGLCLGLRPMGDNSALTHLATGRLILEDGIPRHDPFSFTAPGHAWTVYSWLASTGMALAERAIGDNGIQLSHAVLTMSLGLLAWLLTRPAGALAGRIVAVALVLVLGNSAWPERPLLVALVLFALLILTVEREGPPWAILPIMWVWVNVHGSFPLGVAYLLVRLVGRRIDGSDLRRLPSQAKMVLIGLLVAAINPLGPRLLIFPFELLGRHDILRRVQEWRSPDFSNRVNLLLLAAILLSILMAGRRGSWEDGLTALVFGAAACLAIRNIAPATLVLTPVLARALRGFGSIRGEERNRVTAVALAAIVGVGVVTTAVYLDGPAYDLAKYPEEQLAWMEAQGLLGERIATQDFVGNYLTARPGPKLKVFFDDRFDMYPREVIRDSLRLLDGAEGWDESLDRHRVDVVLWRKGAPLGSILAVHPGWEIVQQDKRWLIAVRRTAQSDAAKAVLAKA